MKRFIFSILAAVAFLCSQTASADNVITRKINDRRAYIDSLLRADSLTYHEYLVMTHKTHWQNLAPHYTKIQFAGSIGLVSIGLGWDYGKREQWETDFMIGVVPKYESHHTKFTFTLRECYIPWSMKIKESNFYYEPLRVSAGVTSITGHEFWSTNPKRYPSGYYFFSTKYSWIAAFGQQFSFHIDRNKRRHYKRISFYYDLGTNSKYVLSGFSNSYIKFPDVFSLDLGLKLKMF